MHGERTRRRLSLTSFRKTRASRWRSSPSGRVELERRSADRGAGDGGARRSRWIRSGSTCARRRDRSCSSARRSSPSRVGSTIARRERIAAVLGSPLGLRWVLGLPAADARRQRASADVLAERAATGRRQEDAAQARRRLLRQIARVRGSSRSVALRAIAGRTFPTRSRTRCSRSASRSDGSTRWPQSWSGSRTTMACQRRLPAAPVRRARSSAQCGLTQPALGRLLDRIREADRRARSRQAGARRGEPAARRLGGAALRAPRPPAPRPDPGGQHRPHARGRQVRLAARSPLLHLRHVVDPPGDHPRPRRSGAHHPRARCT